MPCFISFSIGLSWIFINVVRWHYFLKIAGPFSTPWQSAQSFFAGSLLGITTPGRIGEFGRGIFYEQQRVSDIALVTLTEKFYSTFFILLFGIPGFFLAAGYIKDSMPVPVLTALVPLVLLTILFIILINKGNKISFKGLFKCFPSREADRFFLLTLSNTAYVLTIFQLYCIVLSFCDVKLTTVFIVLSVTLVALTFFPFTIGNLGVREACFIMLFQSVENIPESVSLSASLLFFIQNVFLPAAIGFPLLFWGRYKNSQKSG